MADGDKDAPHLTEPVVINDTFWTGIVVEIADDYVRIVGFSQLPKNNGGMDERRIVSRPVMPMAVARELANALRQALARGRAGK